MGLFDGLFKIGAKMLGKVPVIGSTVNKLVSGPLHPVFSVAKAVANTADDLGVPLAHPFAQGLNTLQTISNSASEHTSNLHKNLTAKAANAQNRLGRFQQQVPQYLARARNHFQDMTTQMMHPAKRARMSEYGTHPPQTYLQPTSPQLPMAIQHFAKQARQIVQNPRRRLY